jgi:hypothetical protein
MDGLYRLLTDCTYSVFLFKGLLGCELLAIPAAASAGVLLNV